MTSNSPWFTPSSPMPTPTPRLSSYFDTGLMQPSMPMPVITKAVDDITPLERLAKVVAVKQKALQALETDAEVLNSKIRVAEEEVRIAQGHVDTELHAQKIAVYEKYGIVLDHFGSIRPPVRSEELTDMMDDRDWVCDPLDGTPLINKGSAI